MASEQLSDPAPADMFTTALHMPYMQDMLVAMSQNKDLAKKVEFQLLHWPAYLYILLPKWTAAAV